MLRKIFDELSFEERFLFGLVFFIVIKGMLVSWCNVAYFDGSYVREDGYVEWFTVDALLLASGLCFWRFFSLFKKKSFFFLATLFIMGLVFLFGAGEEISWGQRIFDIKSPQFFIDHNSQQEINIHNLVFSSSSGKNYKINKIIFGTFLGIVVGIYFLILPFFYDKKPQLKKIVDYFGIPVPKVIHIGFYVLLAAIVGMTTSGKNKELLEMGGCWIFFLMILNPKNSHLFKG